MITQELYNDVKSFELGILAKDTFIEKHRYNGVYYCFARNDAASSETIGEVSNRIAIGEYFSRIVENKVDGKNNLDTLLAVLTNSSSNCDEYFYEAFSLMFKITEEARSSEDIFKALNKEKYTLREIRTDYGFTFKDSAAISRGNIHAFCHFGLKIGREEDVYAYPLMTNFPSVPEQLDEARNLCSLAFALTTLTEIPKMFRGIYNDFKRDTQGSNSADQFVKWYLTR